MDAAFRCFRRARGGFTMAELLVASAISTIVVAGILTTYINVRRRIRSEQILAEVHQNVRFAATYLSRDLALAGYGLELPGSQLTRWITWVPGLNTNPLITQAASDSVTIAAAFERPTTLAASSAQGATAITVAAGGGDAFVDARNRVIYIGRCELARVTALAGNTLTISTDPTASRGLRYAHTNGEPVELVRVYRYAVETAAGAPPSLRRSNLGAVGATAQQETVTEGVENIQLARQSNSVQVIVRGVATRRDDMVRDNDGLRRVTITNAVSLRNL